LNQISASAEYPSLFGPGKAIKLREKGWLKKNNNKNFEYRQYFIIPHDSYKPWYSTPKGD